MPSVAKRWKSNPKYAPEIKSFSFGYAMKLELGQMTENGEIPGNSSSRCRTRSRALPPACSKSEPPSTIQTRLHSRTPPKD